MIDSKGKHWPAEKGSFPRIEDGKKERKALSEDKVSLLVEGALGVSLVFFPDILHRLFFIFENNGISVVFDDMYWPSAGCVVSCVSVSVVVCDAVFPLEITGQECPGGESASDGEADYRVDHQGRCVATSRYLGTVTSRISHPSGLIPPSRAS